jgi:phosphomannomutase
LQGWDKTYCLQFVQDKGFDEIHFFGDKTSEGGNDFEIFQAMKEGCGHTVTSPEDTMAQCRKLFLS